MDRFAKYAFALRLAGWLALMPVRLRLRTLPGLLESLTPPAGPQTRGPERVASAVRITKRVCALPVFRPPLFPRTCLRQSLALYHVLGRLGGDVRIHFGVQPGGDVLEAHSWVTLDGVAVGERRDPELRHLYSYPDTSNPIHREVACP